MIAFGPVPSRRLGRSLGINHIPPRVCTYACVYCQVGRTGQMQTGRRAFHETGEIVQAVRDKIEKARQAGESLDYLTFVPDGEPTLDVNLGREIELLRPLGIKIAVITNGSLIGREDVRAELRQADWVSLKVDSVREAVWRRIDRPHGRLSLAAILDGALRFAGSFEGELATETMLVTGINVGDDQVGEVADFVARLRPDVAYLAIPTRPPAEEWVQAPDEETVHRAYRVFRQRLDRVECLIGYEGDVFACTGKAEDDLLNITAVHPMRAEAVVEFLSRAGADWSIVRRLVSEQKLARIEYKGQTFYVRRFSRRHAGKQSKGDAFDADAPRTRNGPTNTLEESRSR